MKKSDLYRLKKGLESVGALKGFKFAYAVTKNLRLLREEISVLDELRAPSVEYAKYETERFELARQHSKRDEGGNPITTISDNGHPVCTVLDIRAFEKALEDIAAKYESTIEEHNAKIQHYEEFLEEKSEIELFKINQEFIPDDISGDQVDGILEIIRGDKTS